MEPISTVAALYSLFSALSQHGPKRISYEDALAQAQAAINPSYAANLSRTLSAFNTNAASRGVTGQDRTRNQVAAQVSASEAQRSAAVANAAQSIMNGQNAQNLATYQTTTAQNNYQTKAVTDALAALSKSYTNNGTREPTLNSGGYQVIQGGDNRQNNGQYNLNNLDQYFRYQRVN